MHRTFLTLRDVADVLQSDVAFAEMALRAAAKSTVDAEALIHTHKDVWVFGRSTWRLSADEYEPPEHLTFSAGTPGAICERYARGMIDARELVADLLHYPYEDDAVGQISLHSFRQVRRAHRLELIPTHLYKAVVLGRTQQAPRR